MADKAAKESQVGLTPAKGILIGVLAVILVAVLYVQFGRSDKTVLTSSVNVSVTKETTAATLRTKPHRKDTAESVDASKFASLTNWQAPEIASIVQYDPFARPATFPQPVSAALERELAQSNAEAAKNGSEDQKARDAELHQARTQLDELRHRGVQVIIKQQNHFVAMIGDQTIHVGDEIGGFKVIAIDGEGVHVARDLDQ